TGSDVHDLGNVVGEQVKIVQCKAKLNTSLVSSCLHGGAAGNHDHHLGSKGREDVGNGPAETVTIGEQHAHGSNAPGHTEHRKGSAASVVPHGNISFFKQIAQYHYYSCRSASTGSRPAALRAGYRPAMTPARVRLPIASAAVIGTSRGGSKPPGPL